AALLGAGEHQMLAQRVEQGGARVERQGICRAVDAERQSEAIVLRHALRRLREGGTAADRSRRQPTAGKRRQTQKGAPAPSQGAHAPPSAARNAAPLSELTAGSGDRQPRAPEDTCRPVLATARLP